MRLLSKYHMKKNWSGVGYPPVIAGGTVNVQTNVDLVKSGLVVLLNTLPGEAPGYPTFGCELRRLLWEPNDTFFEQDLIFHIRSAVSNWEPRVEIISVEVTDSAFNKNNNIVELSLNFKIIDNPVVTQNVDIPVFVY